jgi:glycosyltransferase involved in cell wall biosynthesis
MSQPRVSVIITSYNQERYLAEAIESVIQQRVRPHEIIIADDHSTLDSSVNVIRSYVSRYSGWVRGVFQSENVGIPRNRNSALQLVTGDHVVVLDGDDRLLPNYIATHVAALAEHPEAGCSYSNRFQMNTQGERLQVRDTLPEPSGNLFTYIAVTRMGILRSMLARYDLVREAGFFDERFFHHDGFVLTLRLAKLTRFVYVPEPLMEKRVHLGGFSKTISYQERILCFEDILPEIIRLSSELPQSEIQRIKRIWLRKLLKLQVWAAIEEGRRSEALSHVIRGFARDPRNIRTLWSLFRRSLRGDL